jgi:hypothetical protein
MPMFVHERLSTRAILEMVESHKKDTQQSLDLFGDPKRSIVDQARRPYVHKDRWVNRMILGHSLVVMNSLLEYEGGRQVQMIYIDPPVTWRRNIGHGDARRSCRHGGHPNDWEGCSPLFKATSLARYAGYKTPDR